MPIPIGIHHDELAAIAQHVQIGHFGHGLPVHHYAMKSKDDRKRFVAATRWQINGVLASLAVVKKNVPDFATRTCPEARTREGEQEKNKPEA
jgi:hypothetical protein